MFRDKSPGVKILWLWTIGTAAVLVTNVARTRLRDMEDLMNAQQEPSAAATAESVIVDSSSTSDEVIGEQKS